MTESAPQMAFFHLIRMSHFLTLATRETKWAGSARIIASNSANFPGLHFFHSFAIDGPTMEGRGQPEEDLGEAKLEVRVIEAQGLEEALQKGTHWATLHTHWAHTVGTHWSHLWTSKDWAWAPCRRGGDRAGRGREA